MATQRTNTLTKILLVEDYESLAMIMQEIVSFAAPSCALKWVDNGQKAVKEIQDKQHYDAIIMNYVMPIIDGIKATQHIRSLGYHGIIIGWSGYPKEEKALDCLAAAMDFYVEKSGDFKPMMELLKALNNGTLIDSHNINKR